MISNLEQVRELVADAIDAPAYLDYPQAKTPKGRFAVVRLMTVPYQKDRLGRDVVSLLTYTIRIHGKGQRDLMGMAEAVDDAVAPYKLTCLGQSPAWSDPSYGPMMTLTYEVLMDRRQNTFSQR